MEAYFLKMADARPTGWGPRVSPPELSANVALTGMEVFVDLADLIDVGAEIARNRQEQVRLEGLIAAKQKKLENENFVQAPPLPWCRASEMRSKTWRINSPRHGP